MLLADKEYILSLAEELANLSEEAHEIIEGKKAALGEEIFLEALRRIALQSTDMLWMDHLEMMDYLRNSVRLRAYGQRDPLVEYKKEGLRLFREMEDEWKNNIVEFVKNISTDVLAAEERRMEEAKRAMERAVIESGTTEGTGAVSNALKNEGKKIGRNDPCYCGSGKKYKHCHGV
jgi:preprotein translocase subunit SecA